MSKRTVIGVVALAFALLTLWPGSRANAEYGTNWTAQYYTNPTLSGDPVVTQTAVPGVNFSWGTGSPAADVPSDNFSARFSSTQTFTGGTYDFVVTSDDGVRVIIDGRTVLDRFYARTQTTDRFTQALTAGQHSLIVEYFEQTDQASISFQWFLVNANTGGGGQVVVTPGAPQVITLVPPGGLQPTAVVTPSGPQAQVTFVRALAIRTGPYLGATYISRLTRDQSYTVLGRNRSEGVYNWYLVQTPDGRQGWASGRYLTLSVEVDAIPEVGSIFDEIDGAPDIGVVAVPRANMVLRQRPSVRSPRIGTIGYGEQVQLIGRTVQAGEDKWYQVRRPSTGEVGWIFAPYITVHGEIYQVPVR